jgi:hypothetical protein
MVALALPRTVFPFPTPRKKSRLDVLSSHTFLYPRIGLWRSRPITTQVEWRGNGKLYCYRFHPHKTKLGTPCDGRLMLTGVQVEALLEFWQDAPLWHRWLPQEGTTRLLVQRMPDGGLQFSRIDRRGQVGITFRLFACDVAGFLAFAERGLPRI